MMTIFAITLKDWNIYQPQPQEYFTTYTKAQSRMDELQRHMDGHTFTITRTADRLEAIRKTGNQAPRVFHIQAINVQ